MSIKLTKKVKIVIGVAVFLVIMAAICWIVALALLDTDIKSEVYAAEFDYVDDVIYDNAYIGMKGGRWQLYRGGDAVSRAFGSLEYSGEGRFSFVNVDGKGWGYVDASGAIIAEFNQNFKPLLPKSKSNSLIAVRSEEGEFSFKNQSGKNHKVKGEFVSYEEFPQFYDAYGDKYVLYSDSSSAKILTAVRTADFEQFTLPYDKTDKFFAAEGFLTVERALASSTQVVTYGADLRQVPFINGVYPYDVQIMRKEYYSSVNGHAVRYNWASGIMKISLSENRAMEFNAEAKVILTDGIRAVVKKSGYSHFYFDGSAVYEAKDYTELQLSGGNVYTFTYGGSDELNILDGECNLIKAKNAESVKLHITKEKNRAKYTLELDCLIADGSLYTIDDGKLKLQLSGVERVVSNAAGTDSRIIVRSAQQIELYDTDFKLTDKLTENAGDAKVIDAFLPAYRVKRAFEDIIIMPRGSFTTDAKTVVISYCTDENNYFAVSFEKDGKTIKVYGKNGALLGESEIIFGNKIILSQTQFIVYGPNSINVVSKGKKLSVKYDEIFFSDNNKYALAVREEGISVINLNDGVITDERIISGGATVTEKGENTFVFKSGKTNLYGIINNGKITLSPTFAQMKLYGDFVIVSVDSFGTSGATYFQADFNGKRISKNYYELVSTEGLTMGRNIDGSIEIMNDRGRAILKNVTVVPENGQGGFEFMKNFVYDEETGRTVEAQRSDGLRLLTVTAGGYKRVISLSPDR